MLDVMIANVATAFEGKFDKGGQPYILHCLAVMYQIPETDIQGRIAAVGHDLLEDCPEWTSDRLSNDGFERDTILVIEAVTHMKGESYEDYIKRVYNAPYLDYRARDIKKADLIHNSNIMRMKGLRAKDFARLEKYHKAYQFLNN